MKINAPNFAISVAVTTAIAWVICSVLVWMMPAPMMGMSGHMVHMDISRTGWMLTPSGFFLGLIAWPLVAGAFAWHTAALYNRLCGKAPDAEK